MIGTQSVKGVYEEAERIILVDTSVWIEIFKDKTGNIDTAFHKMARIKDTVYSGDAFIIGKNH